MAKASTVQALKANPPKPPVDFNPVPSSPFKFSKLPLELRHNTLRLYLISLPVGGQGRRCDCFELATGGWQDPIELTPEHPCYELHAQFKCHAKFLPLLLTSRQMHDEFRPLRYMHGDFHLVPSSGKRKSIFNIRHPRLALIKTHFPNNFYETLVEQCKIAAITPFLNFPERPANEDPSLLPLREVPADIWNEIRIVSLRIKFYSGQSWKMVRGVLEGLVTALKSRKVPLKRLVVKIRWRRIEDVDLPGSYPSFGPLESTMEMWPSMVEPLGRIQWGREGAENVMFQGGDYWDSEEDPAEQRIFQCTSFADFEKGLKYAENEGRLEVVPWHCEF